LEIVVRIKNNTTSRSLSTGNDKENREPENILITMAIGQRMELARFPNANLDLWPVPVKRVFPCEHCGAPVVLVRLGRELKLLDAFENPYSPRYWCRWEADPVIGDHHCVGSLQ
jgi:hypothetical protein